MEDEDKMRYQLYENGEVAKEFTKEEVQQILLGTLDYTQFFKNREESTQKLIESLNGQPKTTGFTVPEIFKADQFERLRKDLIVFIGKDQIPIPTYYMRFISQELTQENI